MIWGELRKGDVIRDPDTGADWTIESINYMRLADGPPDYVDTWLTSDGTDHYPVRKPWTEQAAIVARLPEPTGEVNEKYYLPAAVVETQEQHDKLRSEGFTGNIVWRPEAVEEPKPDPLVVPGSSSKMRESLERGLEQAVDIARSRQYFELPCHFCGEHYHYVCGCMYPCKVCGVIGHEHKSDSHGYQVDLNPPVVQDPELTKTLDEEMEAAQAAFGNDRLELLATETVEETAAREGATKEEPLLLPPIDTALALRSHLYLVHDLYVPDLDPRGPSAGAALKEHHRKSHEDGPMPHPHTHEGTAQ